jgi:hypothetical protein
VGQIRNHDDLPIDRNFAGGADLDSSVIGSSRDRPKSMIRLGIDAQQCARSTLTAIVVCGRRKASLPFAGQVVFSAIGLRA